jgi:lysophospholipase L1-like esterase
MVSRLRVPFRFCVLLLASAASAGAVPLRVVPLGDSITAGIAADGTAGGYRPALAALLAAEGYEIDFRGTFSDPPASGVPDGDHQGLGGATVGDLRAAVPGWAASWEDPDAILLLAGTNDFWRGAQAADVAEQLSKLISEISKLCPAAAIVVGTLPPRTDDAVRDARQDAFNALLPGIVAAQAADGRRVSLADLHFALGEADLTADGVHPNAGGMADMANAWAMVFRSMLEPTGVREPPFLLRAEARGERAISLVFSKPVADDAADLAGYAVSDGVSVQSASLDPAGKREVLLATGSMVAGRVHMVSVGGVKDRSGEARRIAPGSARPVSLPALVNRGFESGFDGWTATGNVLVSGAEPYRPTEGASLAVFNGGNLAPDGVLAQEFTTSPGLMYRLECDIGVLGFNTSEQVIGLVLEGSAVLMDERVTMRAPGSGSIRWTRLVRDFQADGTSLRLRIRDLSAVTASVDLLVDDVRIGLRGDRSVALASSPEAGAFVGIDPQGMPGAPGGGAAAWVGRFGDGTAATLTASAFHRGGRFLRWRKQGFALPDAGRQLSLVVDQDLALVAEYARNEAPAAAPDFHEFVVGKTLLLVAPGVLVNDRDPEGAPLTMRVVEPPRQGGLVADAGGGFRYVPDDGFAGADSFSYVAGDGWADSPPVVVTLVGSGQQSAFSDGTALIRRANDGFAVAAVSSVAGSHRLERSQDLVVWEEMGRVDSSAGVLLTFLDSGPQLPRRFYRIVRSGSAAAP